MVGKKISWSSITEYLRISILKTLKLLLKAVHLSHNKVGERERGGQTLKPN